MIFVGIVAGAIVGLAGAATGTASHMLGNLSSMKLVCGLLFAFGLPTIIMLGSELFTGNMLIITSVLDKRVGVAAFIKNLLFVWIGNWIGGFLIAASCVFSNQIAYSEGQFAVYTIKTAAAKCAVTPGSAIILGIMCNLLVCAGVLFSMAATDVTGKVLGAYLPTSLFVICGFEHCVANMYYIPAGILTAMIPEYAALATEAGIDMSVLDWSHYFITNLLPVTIGNAIGGIIIGLYMWICHPSPDRKTAKAAAH